MLTILSAALAFQIGIRVRTGADSARDSTRAANVSAAAAKRAADNAAQREHRRQRLFIPLTSELLANAYHDASAREIIMRARDARLRQDVALQSYDAVSKQRISAGLGFRSFGRERLAFRNENASRVRWQRGVGAYVDVIGARTAIPLAFPGARVLGDLMEANAIPYYPGKERLLALGGAETMARVNEGMFRHPLTDSAEAYYRYASGDSASFLLPDGKRVRLREIRVTARRPRADLIVGSLWFDVESGQLVRGAFRPSENVDLWKLAQEDDPHAFDDVPMLVKPMISPMELNIAAFTVEYGLYEGRFWLPRIESVEGRAKVGFMSTSFEANQSYRYNSVNGDLALAPIALSKADSLRRQTYEAGVTVTVGGPNVTDSLRKIRQAWRDSLRAMPRAQRDSAVKARRAARGFGNDNEDDLDGLRCPKGPTDTLTRSSLRYDRTLAIIIRVPCDTVALAHSPELPPSIFDPGEKQFDLAARDELVKALTIGLQPGWGPERPQPLYGFDHGLLRYNRVEGLSAGVGLEQNFGAGYSGEALARIGIADWQPNGELHFRRSDGTRTLGVGAYRRLSASNDWGDPFSVGASAGALLFGRDEGFYYRNWGGELSARFDRGTIYNVRLFAEQERRAKLETQASLPHLFRERNKFIDNIVADRANETGLSGDFLSSFGLDPHGWRTTVTGKGEGGIGTFDYSRGMLEMTVSHGLGPRLDGSITGSAGTTGGTVPAQRLFYIGGTQTVRGQNPGEARGNAFWLGRAELGSSFIAARPVVFFDMGWAGGRTDFAKSNIRPISGAGVGASFLDGLFRFDFSKGLQPRKGIRTDFYLEARF